MVKNRGFTLVELLVVVAIMSILTIITVSQFDNAKKKGRDVQRKADLSSLSKALQLYYTDYEAFPLATVGGGISLPGATWGGTFQDATGYVYMKVLPKENVSSNPPYCYKTTADGKKFALFAKLENTADTECSNNKRNPTDATNTYSCNTNTYCYATFSPNTNLSSDGTLQ